MFSILKDRLRTVSTWQAGKYEGQSINNESDHGMGCMSDSIEGIM